MIQSIGLFMFFGGNIHNIHNTFNTLHFVNIYSIYKAKTVIYITFINK